MERKLHFAYRKLSIPLKMKYINGSWRNASVEVQTLDLNISTRRELLTFG